MIKAILFDLGRVIIPFDFERGYRALEPLCPYSASEILQRLRTTDLVKRFETGLIEPEDFVQQVSRLLSLTCDYARFSEVWSSVFYPETLIPESLVQGLHRHYRLVLLSNTNRIHFDWLRENYPLLRHFDAFVLSHEVKAMKPEPLIYQRALEAAACPPGDCFYTDDIAEYVEAAKRLGIDAVQFHSRQQIEAELRARGVAWE